MDAFKILTRSTKLARPSANPSSSHVTPSAGEAINPQLFVDALARIVENTNSDVDGPYHGKKRKRGNAKSSVDSPIPKELDFFNDDVATTDNRKTENAKSSFKGTSITSTGDNPLPYISNEDNMVEELPEEECKRILKSHKIKITQLWTPANLRDDVQVDRTRKKRLKHDDTLLTADMSTKLGKQRLDVIPQPLISFAHLRSRYNLPRKLVANIEEQGYQIPTEVQLGALPLLLGSWVISVDGTKEKQRDKSTSHWSGSSFLNMDLLTVAPTGSGKTLAFLIPVLTAILKNRKANREAAHSSVFSGDAKGPRAIIVAPTKELASQITNEGRKLTRQAGVKVTMVRKGMRFTEYSEGAIGPTEISRSSQNKLSSDSDSEEEAKQNKAFPLVHADVLVCTPLALLNAIRTAAGTIDLLPSIRYLVLDEADVLLDVLFREQTLQIWSACTNPLLRVSLWSATMGSSIEDITKSTIEQRWARLLNTQALHADRPQLIRLVVGLKDSAVPNISHKLVYAASEQGKLMALRQLLRPTATLTNDGPVLQPPFLVFAQTIPRAIALHSELLYDIPQEAGGASRIAVLHADLSDSARERVMTRFRKGEIWVLVTTDLLSRGVDFRGVNGVVNYDFPNSSAAYIHRVGRTGRAGREGGVAVTLYTKEDIPFVKNVANVIAASERQRTDQGGGQKIKQWLLDAMPKPTKRQKQELKKRGIESRRTTREDSDKVQTAARTRISTKSGFERKLENNRKSAVHASKWIPVEIPKSSTVEDDEFSGFED